MRRSLQARRPCPRAVMKPARAFVERIALLLQGAILLRARNPLARDWCVSRLGGGRGASYGTLAAGIDLDAAISRVFSG